MTDFEEQPDGTFVKQPDHPRPCTCHPNDNPPFPCARKYALRECLAADTGGEPK
jgi:hypothetical protein